MYQEKDYARFLFRGKKLTPTPPPLYPSVGNSQIFQSGKVVLQLPTLHPSVGCGCEVTPQRERINVANSYTAPSVSGNGCHPPSVEGRHCIDPLCLPQR